MGVTDAVALDTSTPTELPDSVAEIVDELDVVEVMFSLNDCDGMELDTGALNVDIVAVGADTVFVSEFLG